MAKREVSRHSYGLFSGRKQQADGADGKSSSGQTGQRVDAEAEFERHRRTYEERGMSFGEIVEMLDK